MISTSKHMYECKQILYIIHIMSKIKNSVGFFQAESDKMISQLFKKVTSQLQDCAAIKQGIRTQTEQQLLLVPQASAQSSESAETPLA